MNLPLFPSFSEVRSENLVKELETLTFLAKVVINPRQKTIIEGQKNPKLKNSRLKYLVNPDERGY